MKDYNDVGFVTMAFGKKKYFDQAKSLARSIRLHMPNHEISLITDKAQEWDLFDRYVVMDPYDIAGTFLKTQIYKYSPYEETLFIDSDCVVTRNFEEELAEIRKFDFSPVVNTYLKAGDTDLWLRDVGEALSAVGGSAFPKFNGGVYFFRKGAFAETIFRRAAELRERSEELGVIDFDESGPGEETVIGLALAEMQQGNFYDDGGRLMRTPLNSSGPIHLDVLGGTCHFSKGGQEVRPAICHFCGEWIDHPAYEIAGRELELGRKLGMLEKAPIEARHFAGKVRKKLGNRLGSSAPQ